MNEADVWSLLGALEEQLPLHRDRLEALFATTFETTVDYNKRPLLVAKTRLYELELRAPQDAFEGNLTVRFADSVTVDGPAMMERFPGGSSVPPPPPGIGGEEVAGAYIANRAWGQIWFTFHTGNRLVQLSLGPGMRGSPGV